MENFLNGKSPSFDFAALKRLTISELSYKGAFKYNKICGFTRRQIINMVEHPEHYGNYIVKLSKYMYMKSGYYKRLIDYFANIAVINWTVDTEIKQDKLFSIKPNVFKKNYIRYTAQVNKFKLENRVSDIFKRLFVEDACFGFVTENDVDISIFILESEYCRIEKLVNGSVFQFSINRSLTDSNIYKMFPDELQEIINRSKEISPDNRVLIPYKNSFCIKYNNDFTYLYPPFFDLISAIMEIDDYRDLMKAKTESDAYKLIFLKIPTNDSDQISMGDEIITPFTTMVKNIVPETYGVVPSPMDLQLIESKSTVTEDSNKVEDAVENYYGEAGVSKALISSASSGSELKLSMKVDSSDIYRIYKQFEAWMDLQMKLRGYIYEDYQFVYRILPTTVFDVEDYIDKRLKLAQASLPVKGELLAAAGINTSKMIGNSFAEQLFKESIFDKWIPLRSSYTESGSSDDIGGRPVKSETEISDITQKTHDNDGNDSDNRI